jgi:hypothetical protein
MKQSDLYHMQYITAKSGALKVPHATRELRYKVDQVDTNLSYVSSKFMMWVKRKMLTAASVHGHASQNIIDRIEPLWVTPSGNRIIFPHMAERSW